MEHLIDKYKEQISFSISGYERLILTGSMPEISYGGGMSAYLNKRGIKIFDYAKFAEPFRDMIRSKIDLLVKESGVEVEYINKGGIRKEAVVCEVLKKRGDHPGIVHIISTLETCNTYQPWHEKSTGKSFLKPGVSKCLHYYIYFIDEELGYGYIRIPTWCPFRLQVYVNGHPLLASELKRNGTGYTMIDNAFDSIEDAEKAQELSDSISIEKLHRKMDELAWKYCPVYKELGLRYHWSVMQAEYATDIVFKKQEDLQAVYKEIIATAIHTVKPENIATFLGQKLDPRYKGEIGNNYHVRIEGSRIKHTMGSSSIKMYDKFSKILRIETTSNDISFFKHFREVVHRDGTKSNQTAPLKKNIYSLAFLATILKASNKRYLEFISAFDNQTAGREKLSRICESKTQNNRNYKGFNFFSQDDLRILLAILRGEFNINGMRNKHIRNLRHLSAAQVSRLIKRLRVDGLVKKATDSYKYYLTKLGKQVIIMAQKIKELVIVPAFCS